MNLQYAKILRFNRFLNTILSIKNFVTKTIHHSYIIFINDVTAEIYECFQLFRRKLALYCQKIFSYDSFTNCNTSTPRYDIVSQIVEDTIAYEANSSYESAIIRHLNGLRGKATRSQNEFMF